MPSVLIGRLDALSDERVAIVDTSVWSSRSVLGIAAMLDDLEAMVLPIVQRRAAA